MIPVEIHGFASLCNFALSTAQSVLFDCGLFCVGLEVDFAEKEISGIVKDEEQKAAVENFAR